MTKAAGHYQQPIEGHIGKSVGMAEQHELLEVDLQFGGGTGHKASSLSLIDSGTSHNSLSEWISLAAGLCVDHSCNLNGKLAVGEKHASLGLAHGVQITFAPGVV